MAKLPRMDIYLATGNAHKVEEIGAMLAALGLDVKVHSAKAIGGMPEVEENGDTFAANAQLKAAALLPQVPTGGFAMADDSGLAVDALDGAPGIYSARYAARVAPASNEGVSPEAWDALTDDAKNNLTLLQRLAAVSSAERTARFVCVFSLLGTDGTEQTFTGECHGRIIGEARGGSGFGYDPLFVPDGCEQTFAELGAGVKNGLSHRARAVDALAQWLRGR